MLPLAINIAFFGHVDCGKSTTIGRLLVDTNSVEIKRKSGKNQQQLNYAWITDELEEERNRGITMDVMLRSIHIPEVILNIIDTPGHTDYISNLFKGLCQADIAVYIVDATIGNFESTLGQGNNSSKLFKPYNLNKSTLSTHIMLAKSFGIPYVIILINKMDAIDFNKDRFDSISSIIKECLLKYHYKENSYEIIPISAIKGINIIESISNNSLDCWYNGYSLMESMKKYHKLIQSKILEESRNKKELYISIFDFYMDKSNQVTIVGKILQGTLISNTKLLISPSNQIINVKEIYRNNDNLLSSYAYSNDYIQINVVDCDFEQLKRGDIITNHNHLLIKNSKIRCNLITTDIPYPLTPGMHLIFHSYNIMTNVAISRLIQQTLKTGPVDHPLIIGSNTCAKLEIMFERPCCVQKFSYCKPLGRFCLTSVHGIVAVGVIEEIL